MAGARASLQGAAKEKKTHRVDWWLITLLFFNFTFLFIVRGFFISFVRLEFDSTWTWAGAAEAPHWELSAFEDVGQSTKIPLQIPQPKAHCPSSSSSSSQEKVLAAKYLSQVMEPQLRDTPELKPKSQIPFAEGPHCDPSLAQAVPGHVWRCARLWQWDGIEPWTPQLWAGHAAPDSCPGVALTRL